jgi:hypothetical protein
MPSGTRTVRPGCHDRVGFRMQPLLPEQVPEGIYLHGCHSRRCRFQRGPAGAAPKAGIRSRKPGAEGELVRVSEVQGPTSTPNLDGLWTADEVRRQSLPLLSRARPDCGRLRDSKNKNATDYRENSLREGRGQRTPYAARLPTFPAVSSLRRLNRRSGT